MNNQMNANVQFNPPLGGVNTERVERTRDNIGRIRVSPHFTEPSKSDYSLSMRTLFIIPLVLMSLVLSKAFAIEYMPKVEVDLFCKEIDAKAYYVDGAVDHVKLDGEGLDVDIRPTYLTTKYPSFGSPNKFDYVSGFHNEPQKYMNLSFVSKYGGTWGTKTVTFMFDGNEGKFWLIQTEPMIDKGRPMIRTYYHVCRKRK